MLFIQTVIRVLLGVCLFLASFSLFTTYDFWVLELHLVIILAFVWALTLVRWSSRDLLWAANEKRLEEDRRPKKEQEEYENESQRPQIVRTV